jgi:hypothetical protein
MVRGGLLSTPRAFPAGTIGVTFYEHFNLGDFEKITYRPNPHFRIGGNPEKSLSLI